jgi:hypothetical protein
LAAIRPRAERGTNLQELLVGDRCVYVARDWKLDLLDGADGSHLGAI